MTALVSKRTGFEKRNRHLNYTLDERFIKIFAPIRIVQKLFGTCRVDIRDGQVAAPTVLQKCYTLASLAASTYLGSVMLMTYAEKCLNDDTMSRIFFIGLSLVNFVCALNIFYCRFITRGNVELFEKMEIVDRVMKLKCSDINKLRIKQYNYNRAVVLWVAGIFIALAIFTFYFTGGAIGIQYEILGNYWGIISFVFELVCCVSHIKFFTMRVNLINTIIAKHLQWEKNYGASVSTSLIHLLNKPYNQQQNLVSSDTDVYLNDILSAFTCFQNQYRFQIFTFCSMFVVGSVIFFQFIITEFQSNVSHEHFLLDFMQVTIFNAVEISMLLFISLYSEEFLREVKKTKKLSNSILSRYVDGPLREKAKRMLKLIEHEPPRFSVYGMWDIDARLLLNMFRILTSYFVIILQFAFS